MKTVLFFMLFLLLTFAEGRENPFAPVQSYAPLPLIKTLPTPEIDKQITPVIEKAKCKTVEVKTEKTTQKVWKTTEPIHEKIVKTHQKKIKHKPRKHKIKKIHHKAKFRLVYQNLNLKIYTKSNYIKIITKDQLISDLLIYHPTRLVLDFGDDFVIYKTIQKSLRNPYIKTLKIGTHNCFYRLTLVLKNKDRYKVKKTSYGYLIKLF